ncbi:MAG: DUF4335 domain-containing protein [Microcoleus sp. PH2017_01_SCD_O_A]|uniref:DUF4335 domain-containing protein n=1 Tax=unclassified Microcoleus TaxID=2642155 RepID=UPI001DDBE01E|nr:MULTISPECIES: DUF4335 domain-containing protein [unclassified Microcoleus]MCC3422790.1 DUF4335 domain-containing protein [Microcoleus sp. PH2017_01_SCD_O_A]MCC3453045.1 DUF4335 domain-containing protein [Microcoleus sp. PH2017_08_TRC_O_A]MCC3508789.1 DUF4335 domain-containing protein [Microcoleus sp. PH2017_17_BER_D_A]TAG64980.1 MAG: DUF4335 domain-containing protein [Oscillatoriales cyanobacterium]
MALKRYTPPTCTLEITAKSSPLSRWAGKPVFKSLNFELRLDDPRLPDTEHVTLRGDRNQLETLHEAVTNYVQNFLGEARDWDNNLNSQTGFTTAPDSPEVARNVVTFDRPLSTSELATAAPNTTYLPVPPRLEPRGLLAHNLFLGSLSAAESGPEVHLSTLQLFDLATALDDCAAEVMAVPNLNRDRPEAKALPWLNIAAILVASVGMTTGIVKMLDRSSSNTSPTTATAPVTAPTNPQFTPALPQPQILAGANPSPVPAPTTSPTTSPTATPTAAATPGLPPLPPPPINTAAATPSPSLPPIALAPSPSTNKPSPIQQPPLLFPPNSSAPAASQSAPALSQGQIITIPDPAGPPIAAPQAPYLLPPIPPRLAPAVPPPLPPSLSASRFPVPPPQSFPPLPQPISPPSTELPPLEDTKPQAESEDNNRATASKKNRTLFDTIPQVSEARTYFEERWKPPEGMEQTLEYSLQIDENGSIQTIVPMGKAAADYIDRASMPLVGEPFVSAVTHGKNPKIRVVLRPNGRVQTFLEETN